MDLDHTYLAPSAEAIRRDFGFEPIFDHFAIFGWCNECREHSEHSERGERIECSESRET